MNARRAIRQWLGPAALLRAMVACATLLCAAASPAVAGPTDVPVQANLVLMGADESPLAWRWAPSPAGFVPLNDTARVNSPVPAGHVIELGSLWKLVSWRALVEQQKPDRPLQCTGASREEVYCCSLGQSVSRDDALARSCGLYFSAPHTDSAGLLRAAVQGARKKTGAGDAWPPGLLDAMTSNTLGPDTRVPLHEWLNWLNHWPEALRRQAQDALLVYWLEGAGQELLGSMGSRLRAKTFTLELADGTRFGGASGWTQSGQAFWLGARGSSTTVMKQMAPAAAGLMEQQLIAAAGRANNNTDDCIDVQYFARYPVKTITPEPSGVIEGPARISFANGNSLDVPRGSGLRASRLPSGEWSITARLTLDEYVARVVDREGAAEPAQAARALAVAARSYALSRADRVAGCWRISDSSATQRVSPRPASARARAAAWATAGFLLQAPQGKTPGQYHNNAAKPGVMSWQAVVADARQGSNFNALLSRAYPEAHLVTAQSHLRAGCAPLPLVQAWLTRQMTQWQTQLVAQAGYRAPGPIRVCQLQQGAPHAALTSQSIYVQGIASMEERLSVVHEYLHLAFARHPRSQDEAFVEALARQLLGAQ